MTDSETLEFIFGMRDAIDIGMKRIRPYRAPLDNERCIETRKPLKDGSLARCMRKRVSGSEYCSIHSKGNEHGTQKKI